MKQELLQCVVRSHPRLAGSPDGTTPDCSTVRQRLVAARPEAVWGLRRAVMELPNMLGTGSGAALAALAQFAAPGGAL